MIDPYLGDLVAFLEQIARNGWAEEEHWRSEFGEVDLWARNLGDGVVAVRFHLWWAQGPTLDNEREGELHVGAGALPRFAAQVRELTGYSGDAERLSR